MMKIGITGAEGFIGTHLVRYLDGRPELSVECFDGDRCDLAKPETLAAFVRDKDCIVHLASVISGKQEDMWINEYGTYNLIKAIGENSIRRVRLIFSSTVQVYGYSEACSALDEDTVLNPANFHAFTKIMTERTLLLFQDIIQPVILRLTNVYGYGCQPFYNSAPATFIHRIAGGESIVLNNGGKQKRDFLYVKDLCELIYQFIVRGDCARVIYNVATGLQVEIRELVELISSYLGREAAIEYRSIDEPVNRSVISNRRLLQEIDSYSFTGLEAGLKEYIDEYKESTGYQSG